MQRTSHRCRRLGSRRAAQRGFTMTEVMMSLVVFIIALVGLVATQSRGIEAQQGAMEMRDAERIGQQVMNDLQSRGFDQLATVNFQGVGGVFPPYADTTGGTGSRLLFDFNGVPVEDRASATRLGVREQFFAVFRRIDPVPITATTPDELDAVAITVQVLWIDTTNPALPPPATATVDALTPAMVDPTDTTNYRDYVRAVELRTVRINDNASLEGTVGAPAP